MKEEEEDNASALADEAAHTTQRAEETVSRLTVVTVSLHKPVKGQQSNNPSSSEYYKEVMAQILPTIEEEASIPVLEKLKKPRKPRNKKNKKKSNNPEQALQMLPANINPADEEIKLDSLAEPSTSKIMTYEKIKPLCQSAEQVATDSDFNKDPVAKMLPVIAEAASTSILGKSKKSRRRKKKFKNLSSTTKSSSITKEALQMQPATINQAPSSANDEIKFVEPFQEAKAINDDTNASNKKIKTEPQTREKSQENDKVNNNITEILTKTKHLLAEDERSQTSKDAIKELDKNSDEFSQTLVQKNYLPTEDVSDLENLQTLKNIMKESVNKAEGGAQSPVQRHYLPTENVGKYDEEQQISSDAVKKSDMTVKGDAQTPVQSHLLFFREFYNRRGRLNVPNFDEEKSFIDYSQVKIAYLDPPIKNKIEAAIHSIMNDITIDFKDFRVPQQKLEVLFNRMHNIIFTRLYGIGFTELASVEICNIVAIYRTHFNRSDDIRFLYTLL